MLLMEQIPLSYLVIETENFACVFFDYYSLSDSLLTCLLLRSLKTVLLYFMNSNCCIHSYIPNYSFCIFED